MLPFTFNFPFMKSCCGFDLPVAIATRSSSDTVMLQSGLPALGGPTATPPAPFLRSTVHCPTVFPSFVTFHKNTPLIFFTSSGRLEMRRVNSSNRASLFSPDVVGFEISAFTSCGSIKPLECCKLWLSFILLRKAGSHVRRKHKRKQKHKDVRGRSISPQFPSRSCMGNSQSGAGYICLFVR